MNRETENEQLLVSELKKRCDMAASQVLKTFLTIKPICISLCFGDSQEEMKKRCFTISFLVKLIFDYHKNG